MATELSLEDIIQKLAPALGEEKSRSVVETAAKSCSITGETLTKDLALEILDCVAKEPGIVGASARFAKVNLILS